jgi:hypothetical protein
MRQMITVLQATQLLHKILRLCSCSSHWYSSTCPTRLQANFHSISTGYAATNQVRRRVTVNRACCRWRLQTKFPGIRQKGVDLPLIVQATSPRGLVDWISPSLQPRPPHDYSSVTTVQVLLQLRVIQFCNGPSHRSLFLKCHCSRRSSWLMTTRPQGVTVSFWNAQFRNDISVSIMKINIKFPFL